MTRHEQISGNLGALVTDQGKPSKGGNPISPAPSIKPNEEWLDSQEELPYQEGPALPSPQEEKITKDPSREINMVHLLEIEDDNDSMERVNLDDYNSYDYKQYLSDEDMLDDPAAARAKTAEHKNPPPPPPPAVTVTVKLEDEDREDETASHRARNQKCAERRQRLLDRLQEDVGEPHDYSNNDLRNVINVG